MPKIIPFQATRPTRDKVGLVACRSYESYSIAQREARLRDNPFSFLQIINPGFKYQKEISGEQRYQLVKNRFQEFKEDNIFVQDEEPAFYIYKIVNKENLVFHGIIGAASVEDYEKDNIKKHESTIEDREKLFKGFLKTVGFNAESVLLTYPDNKDLQSIINQVMQERAEYEFTTTYRDTHYLWTISNPELISKIGSIFSQMKSLYIADGHHRSASSFLLAQDYKQKDKKEDIKQPYNYFMSYLIPESELKIYEFNRLVKDLNGLTKEEFLIQLDTTFRIENKKLEYYKPVNKHCFSMYLDGEFYSLKLRKHLLNFNTSLEALDTQILYDTVLRPILNIKNLRNNKRLHYSNGKMDLAHVSTLVDSGKFKVGFGLVPITIEEIKKVANEGFTMPPKSTYIEPKLRSGVTIYEF